MEVAFLSRLPWLPLLLLWLTYVLLGWHLSAYSTIWLVCSFALALILAVILLWSSTRFLPKISLGIRYLILGLTLSALFGAAFVFSRLFLQLVLLLAAELWVDIELLSLDLSRKSVLWILILSTELGLGLGWLTGTVLLPSSRYWSPVIEYLDQLWDLA